MPGTVSRFGHVLLVALVGCSWTAFLRCLSVRINPAEKLVQATPIRVYTRRMDVTFAVADRTYTVPERQATILAENLRLLAKSEPGEVQGYAEFAVDDDWREGASALADSIEEALVGHVPEPLPLEGGAADATYRILRLMIGLESSLDVHGAGGLRDALGTPVSVARTAPTEPQNTEPAELARFLTAPELVELLAVLFALAVLTVIVTAEGIVAWYVIAPVIAALLGVRVATTRVKGKIAWSLASVLWWAIFLIPATILVLLVALVIAAILR